MQVTFFPFKGRLLKNIMGLHQVKSKNFTGSFRILDSELAVRTECCFEMVTIARIGGVHVFNAQTYARTEAAVKTCI